MHAKMKFRTRDVFVVSAADAAQAVRGLSVGRFLTLLPAAASDAELVELVDSLTGLGCAAFCSIGPLAEHIHDVVDSVVEERKAISIETTFDVDELEGIEYFLLWAGGSSGRLLAVLEDDARLLAVFTDFVCSHGKPEQ